MRRILPLLALAATAGACSLAVRAELLNPWNKSGRTDTVTSAPAQPSPLPTPPPAATPSPTPTPEAQR
jgi:hypothetical protein